jgi:hypothetical protein
MENKTTNKSYKINLGDYQSPESKIFSGQKRGQDLREKLRIDKIEKEDSPIQIIIPMDTYAVNPSFFLGFLGKSIKSLGEKIFRTKFQFECSKVIKDNIEEGISYSIKFSNVFD